MLVVDELIGLSEGTAPFSKAFGDVRGEMADAIDGYVDAVEGDEFPAEEHSHYEDGLDDIPLVTGWTELRFRHALNEPKFRCEHPRAPAGCERFGSRDARGVSRHCGKSLISRLQSEHEAF